MMRRGGRHTQQAVDILCNSSWYVLQTLVSVAGFRFARFARTWKGGFFVVCTGLQGVGKDHFWGLQDVQVVRMEHFWGLHELQVKKKGSFLLLHGVQTSCEGPF